MKSGILVRIRFKTFRIRHISIKFVRWSSFVWGMGPMGGQAVFRLVAASGISSYLQYIRIIAKRSVPFQCCGAGSF